MRDFNFILSILCLIWITHTFNMDYAQIPQFLQSQVKSNPSFYHSAWKKLAYFTDSFGPRMWGSQQQTQAILQIYNQAQQDAFESDGGSMSLYGFGHQGSGTDQFKKVLKYLEPIGAGTYSDDGYSADVYPLFEQGVPIIRNLIKDTLDDSFYYTYHHSPGDSMEIMDPDQLDENVVGIASLLYIVADMQDSLRQVSRENIFQD